MARKYYYKYYWGSFVFCTTDRVAVQYTHLASHLEFRLCEETSQCCKNIAGDSVNQGLCMNVKYAIEVTGM